MSKNSRQPTTQKELHDHILSMQEGTRGFVNVPGNECLQEFWPAWNERLTELLQESAEDPSVAISLIGNSGAGKSTLINAIIGARILPVSNNTACTSAITDVGFGPGHFTATVEFVSRESWQTQLTRDLEAALVEIETSPNSVPVLQDLPGALRDRIVAAYRASLDHVVSPNLAQTLSEPSEIREALDAGTIQFSFESAEQFRKQVSKYLVSKDAFWPIVSKVTLRGPFDNLRDGIRLIDLPGLNDPNEARNKVTTDYLKQCRFVWFVFKLARNLTKDNVHLMQSNEFVSRIIRDQRAGSLTFIGTAADDVSVDDGIDELELSDDSTKADVVRANNLRVRDKVRELLERVSQDVMKSVSNEDWDAAQAIKEKLLGQSKVFTVAAKDYLKQIRCLSEKPELETLEDTEIPHLVQHMQQTCQRHGVASQIGGVWTKLEQLKNDIRRAITTMRHAIAARKDTTESQRKEIQAATNAAKGFLEAKTPEAKVSLQEGLRRDKVLLEQRIKQAISSARNDLDDVLDRWSKIHWKTLKAVCVHGGVHQGSKGKNDFPADVSKSILEVITVRWAEFFGDRVVIQLENAVVNLNRTTEEFGRTLLDKVSAITNLPEIVPRDLGQQLQANKRSLDASHDERREQAYDQITAKQRDLSETVQNQIRNDLQPAFETASEESGTGMKDRIIDILAEQMRHTASTVFRDVERSLVEGVNSINDGLIRTFDEKMSRPVINTGDIAIHNLLRVALPPKGTDESELRVLDAFEKHIASYECQAS